MDFSPSGKKKKANSAEECGGFSRIFPILCGQSSISGARFPLDLPRSGYRLELVVAHIEVRKDYAQRIGSTYSR